MATQVSVITRNGTTAYTLTTGGRGPKGDTGDVGASLDLTSGPVRSTAGTSSIAADQIAPTMLAAGIPVAKITGLAATATNTDAANLTGTLAPARIADASLTWAKLIGTTAGVQAALAADPAASRALLGAVGTDVEGGIFLRCHHGNAAQKLFIDVSTDGLNFYPLTNWALYNPTTPVGAILRDPSIIWRNGFFWIVYTQKAFVGNNTAIGIAKSPNLIDWTYVASPSTASIGDVQESYAPEWFLDDDNSVIITVGVSKNVNSVMSVYYMTPTSNDLSSWTNPALLVPSPSIPDLYDQSIIKTGLTYRLLVKNRGGAGEMWMSTSTSKLSGYGAFVQIGASGQHEGPNAVRMRDRWRIYYDPINTPIRYEDTTDWLTFTAPAEINQVGGYGSHGTTIRVAEEEAAARVIWEVSRRNVWTALNAVSTVHPARLYAVTAANSALLTSGAGATVSNDTSGIQLFAGNTTAGAYSWAKLGLNYDSHYSYSGTGVEWAKRRGFYVTVAAGSIDPTATAAVTWGRSRSAATPAALINTERGIGIVLTPTTVQIVCANGSTLTTSVAVPLPAVTGYFNTFVVISDGAGGVSLYGCRVGDSMQLLASITGGPTTSSTLGELFEAYTLNPTAGTSGGNAIRIQQAGYIGGAIAGW